MTRLLSEALSQEMYEVETPEQDSQATTLELESIALESAEISHELALEGYRLEELEHVAMTLESIHDAMSNKLNEDERGLDRYSAEAYQHAIYSVLGDAVQTPMASLESFGSQSESYRATELSLEGVSDTIAKIIKAIGDAISKVWEMVTDLAKKLVGSVDALEKKRSQVIQKAKTIKSEGQKPKQNKFKVPKLDKIHFKGSGEPDQIHEGLSTIRTATSQMITELASGVQDYFEGIYKHYRSVPDDYKPFKEATKSFTDAVTNAFKKAGATPESPAPMPGNQVLVVKVEKSGSGDDAVEEVTGFSIETGSGKEPDDEQQQVPSADQIIQMAQDLEEVVSHLRATKDRLDGVVKASKDAYEAMQDKFQDGVIQNTDDQDKGALKGAWDQQKVRMALSRSRKQYAAMLAKMDNHFYQYTKNMLSYLDNAAKQYEPAKGSGDSGDSNNSGGGSNEGSGDEE